MLITFLCLVELMEYQESDSTHHLVRLPLICTYINWKINSSLHLTTQIQLIVVQGIDGSVHVVVLAKGKGLPSAFPSEGIKKGDELADEQISWYDTDREELCGYSASESHQQPAAPLVTACCAARLPPLVTR